MNLSDFALKKRVITIFTLFLIFAGGVMAYIHIGVRGRAELLQQVGEITRMDGFRCRQGAEQVGDVGLAVLQGVAGIGAIGLVGLYLVGIAFLQCLYGLRIVALCSQCRRAGQCQPE